jgi:hypothetical protein
MISAHNTAVKANQVLNLIDNYMTTVKNGQNGYSLLEARRGENRDYCSAETSTSSEGKNWDRLKRVRGVEGYGDEIAFTVL